VKKEQLTELGIAEDVVAKVLALYDDEVKGLIPKEKTAELDRQLKAANGVIAEGDKQLTTLKKQAEGNEELTKQIAALQEANKAQKAEFEAQIQSIKVNSAIEAALTKAGAKNIKAARALLNTETISLDEKGEAVGLNEQIEALKGDEGSSFLFAVQGAEGFTPGQGTNPPEVDTSKMNYTQMCAYLDEHPGATL